jgi:hypothetical protein
MLRSGQFQGDIRVWVAFRKSILGYPAKATLWQSDLKWFFQPISYRFFHEATIIILSRFLSEATGEPSETDSRFSSAEYVITPPCLPLS